MDHLPSDVLHPEPGRRRFLQTSCVALLALGAGSLTIASCDSGGADAGLGIGDPGITREGAALVIDTAQFDALAGPSGSLWVSDVRVLVVHTIDLGYRAFDGVCPHEGQDIEVFERSGDTFRLRCPAHDWTFDLAGNPTGPSRSGTARLPLEQDGALLRIALPR